VILLFHWIISRHFLKYSPFLLQRINKIRHKIVFLNENFRQEKGNVDFHHRSYQNSLENVRQYQIGVFVESSNAGVFWPLRKMIPPVVNSAVRGNTKEIYTPLRYDN
jgi:hypothetical protein